MYDPVFQQKLAALPKEQRKAYEKAADQLGSEVRAIGFPSPEAIEMLFSTRPKVSIAYNEELLKIARKLGERRAEAIAIGELSLAYARLGDLRQAISFFQQHLEIARELGEQQWVASDLNNLANAHLKLGYGSKAIGYYEQSLAIAREANDINWIAMQSFNIASVYKDQEDFERALPMVQQAVEIWEKTGNPSLRQAKKMMKEIQNKTTMKPSKKWWW